MKLRPPSSIWLQVWVGLGWLAICSATIFLVDVVAGTEVYSRHFHWSLPILKLTCGTVVAASAWWYERGWLWTRCGMLVAGLGGLGLAGQMGWLTVEMIRRATWSPEHPPVGVGMGIVLTLLFIIFGPYTLYRAVCDLTTRTTTVGKTPLKEPAAPGQSLPPS